MQAGEQQAKSDHRQNVIIFLARTYRDGRHALTWSIEDRSGSMGYVNFFRPGSRRERRMTKVPDRRVDQLERSYNV